VGRQLADGRFWYPLPQVILPEHLAE
jgi:hypothetical protein